VAHSDDLLVIIEQRVWVTQWMTERGHLENEQRFKINEEIARQVLLDPSANPSLSTSIMVSIGDNSMQKSDDNRSVNVGGNVTGSSVVTGDNNRVSTRMTQHTLPSPETVDVKAELAAIKDLLAGLNVPERDELDHAVQAAERRAAKPDPDKKEIAVEAERIVKYAKAADDFGEHAAKILPRLVALGSWLGTHGHALLAMLGVAV
jgi:hypothetical protein